MSHVMMLSVATHTEPIHPVLISNDEALILIDCGYQHFFSLVEAEILRQGCDPNRLTAVIITHHDHDHLGGLHELKEKYPAVRVMSSAIEAPYISGQKKSLRLAQAEALQASLPAEKQEQGYHFQAMLKEVIPTPVDKTLTDGEHLAGFGLEVVATPGHMPGHIALYHRATKSMICGDALVITGGLLGPANPQYTFDSHQALLSVKKMAAYPIERLLCYHGGLFTGEAGPALERLLSASGDNVNE